MQYCNNMKNNILYLQNMTNCFKSLNGYSRVRYFVWIYLTILALYNLSDVIFEAEAICNMQKVPVTQKHSNFTLANN